MMIMIIVKSVHIAARMYICSIRSSQLLHVFCLNNIKQTDPLSTNMAEFQGDCVGIISIKIIFQE